MIQRNVERYIITVSEDDEFRIPDLDYRGSSVCIDIVKVLDTGITPVMDAGRASRNCGQIGVGAARAPLECFEFAADAYQQFGKPYAQ